MGKLRENKEIIISLTAIAIGFVIIIGAMSLFQPNYAQRTILTAQDLPGNYWFQVGAPARLPTLPHTEVMEASSSHMRLQHPSGLMVVMMDLFVFNSSDAAGQSYENEKSWRIENSMNITDLDVPGMGYGSVSYDFGTTAFGVQCFGNAIVHYQLSDPEGDPYDMLAYLMEHQASKLERA